MARLRYWLAGLRFEKCWFRSSVGLEQQPSKLWVLGSNPNGITIIGKMKLICTK